MTNWGFAESEETEVTTVKKVIDRERSIRYVIRHESGAWDFLDAANYELSDRRTTTLRQLFDIDPSIGELANLQPGQQAQRADGGFPWQLVE